MDKKSLLACHFAWHIGDGLNVKGRPYWRGQLCVRRSLLSRLCERRQLKNNLRGGWAPLLSLLSSPVRSRQRRLQRRLYLRRLYLHRPLQGSLLLRWLSLSRLSVCFS